MKKINLFSTLEPTCLLVARGDCPKGCPRPYPKPWWLQESVSTLVGNPWFIYNTQFLSMTFMIFQRPYPYITSPYFSKASYSTGHI